MNRFIIATALVVLAGTFTASAQKKAVKLMEQTEARYVEPKVRVYITPQIADMKMLTEEREQFGPYRFDVPVDWKTLTNMLLTSVRNVHSTMPLPNRKVMHSSSLSTTCKFSVPNPR